MYPLASRKLSLRHIAHFRSSLHRLYHDREHQMNDPSRTNSELSQEISALQQKIRELEQSESERKRADEALRGSEEYFKAIIQKELLIPNVFRLMHKDGAERTLEGVGKNLLDNPIVAGFVMNVRDITDRKQVEIALTQQTTITISGSMSCEDF
jgi:PAS domain S-box-containing protein